MERPFLSTVGFPIDYNSHLNVAQQVQIQSNASHSSDDIADMFP